MTISAPCLVPSPGTRIGDYEVIEEVGRGGMAVILSARHADTGERRAIKLVLPGSHHDEVVRRFHLEYDTLARMDHAGVLRVFETGIHDGRPYIVMEFIDGIELGAAVESWKEHAPSDRFASAQRVLVSVAKALEYVHSQGLVHRDVTPSNVMVLSDGSIRLMDFGVVKEPGADLTTVGEVVGTAAYIAPEQINGARVDSRTDLYALGAVLYLMLTGRRPFSARTLAGYLEKHLHRPVRPPREIVPTIPKRLNDVCVRLLEKDPTRRFGSASHLLHALNESSASDAALDAGSWDPGVVGRAGELAQVREAMARLAAGQGGLLVIEATYGMGRSALAADAASQAERFGIPHSIGRSTAPDQRAFETYRETYRALVDESTGPTALAVAFGERQAGDATLEKWRVFSAFKALMEQQGPHLLILDDLDCADRGSIEMTEYLARNLVGEANGPLLILVTREPPMGMDPLRDLLNSQSVAVDAEQIRLGPLDVGAVEELLLSLVHDDPRVGDMAKRLHREGEGVPFFIREMLRVLMEQGVIERQPDGRRGRITLDRKAIAESTLPVPSSIREAIQKRVAPLSASAKRLMGVLAVARVEVDESLLSYAALLDPDTIMASIEELIDSGLVRERQVGETERFELAQNRLRDVVMEDLAPPVRQQIHRRIGEGLERIHRRRIDSVVESLAHHFEQGEVASKAYPYLIQASDKLMQRTFVREALEYLERALRIEADAREYMTLEDADLRLADLRLKRARALYHLGALADSSTELAAANALADELGEPRLRIGVATEIGFQNRRVRLLDEAEQHLLRAVELAREHGERQMEILPLYEMGGVAWSRGDLDSARNWWVEGLARSEQFSDETKLAWGYGGLGLLAMCKGQSAEARRKLEQAIEVCERHGLMERLTVARINLIELYHFTGNFRKGLQISDDTVNQSREVAYRAGEALGMRYRTILLTDIGRYGEAMENAMASLRLHRELDTKEDELASLVVACRAGLAQGVVGDLEPMLDAATELLTGYDTEGFAPVVHAWRARVYALQGRLSEACDAIELAGQSEVRAWPGQRVRASLNLARVYRLLDARDEAFTLAEEALRLADASGYRHYAMRARRLIIECTDDEVAIARHRRVAEALARSLAANLSREDATSFLAMHGIKPRVSLI
ncbi:MAG: protein kinase [Myxococcota bacterium]|nr:protein kinase [Myxococcota bacterium]